MAKEIPNLVAEARAGSGKGAARQTRRDGKVPGIVYGDGKEPVSIAFDFNMAVWSPLTFLNNDGSLDYVAAESVETDDATTYGVTDELARCDGRWR